jgi:hypothetical protein
VVTVRGKTRLPTCRRCGTSLYGRFEGLRNRARSVVEVYRCPCGQGREVVRVA